MQQYLVGASMECVVEELRIFFSAGKLIVMTVL